MSWQRACSDTCVSANVPAAGGVCAYSDNFLIVADTGNAVLRCVRTDDESCHVNTIAGVVQKQGATDGWDNMLHSPTSVVRLPGGELLVADTGNHTIRLVELGGHPKQELVVQAVGDRLKQQWEKDLQLQRVAKQRKQQVLGKLTTVAGMAGAMGCADGPTGESRLASPTSLVLSGKCTEQSSTVLFLQAGGYTADEEGPPLLRLLKVTRSQASGKPSDTLPPVRVQVSTLHRFGEAPRRGPSSVVELNGSAKELLVADEGSLQLLTLDGSKEYVASLVHAPPSEGSETGPAITLAGEGDVHLAVMPSGVHVAAHARPGGALYRLLSPHVWKKAERR
jgi:hypothetical protein